MFFGLYEFSLSLSLMKVFFLKLMFRRVFVIMKKFGGKKKNRYSKIIEISVFIVVNEDVLGFLV